MPKRGFTNYTMKCFAEVTLEMLQEAFDSKKLSAAKPIDVATLVKAGVISCSGDGLRLPAQLLKDEFSRKDVAASELEFKINNLLHQNQDIAVENDRLKHELARLEEIYGAKIHELEGQLAMETRNFEDTTMQYNSEFEKFKKEGQEYVEQLTFEFERKIKGLEEKTKALENARKVTPSPRRNSTDTRTKESMRRKSNSIRRPAAQPRRK